MTGISQLKTQWEREAREDERKLIADWIKRTARTEHKSNITPILNELFSQISAAIRNGSYRDKP